jgi:hypothetical protein
MENKILNMLAEKGENLKWMWRCGYLHTREGNEAAANEAAKEREYFTRN